ncbi:esterase-5B-like [Drosophila busckii]|uniref:esterase-5B-like n=1 Tax=Drosophila busckii TaxID=30019 RepID=UPI00083EBC58|nr:esterase-5B-like [Drosophila busckii]
MHYIKVLITLISLSAAAATDSLNLELPFGIIKGRDNGGYLSYEGIPYAEPPLGALRFEAPKPYSQHWNETFDATKPPVLCMQWNEFVEQPDKLLGTEDCLTVSIYKPKAAKALPVVVLIHGGGFMYDGAAKHGHETLMASGHVIVVKISYRVGPLGFLSSEDAALTGNYGLKDQRLALQWIKSNIHRFGGEPNNILVMGHSAGGASVHLQLLQKNFEHVAKAAFSLSGTALNPWVVQRGAKQRAYEMGRILGCGTGISSLVLKQCLQAKQAAEIVRAVQQFLVFGYVPFTTFGPVVESADSAEAFLTQHPLEIIRAAAYAQVPWLASYTSEDGGYNAATLLQQQSNGQERIEQLNSRWFDLAPHLLFYRQTVNTIEEMDAKSFDLRQQYMGNSSFNLQSYLALQRMFTDVLFKNDTELALRLHAKHGKSPVYGFVYDNPADSAGAQLLGKRNDVQFGTMHGDDYTLIFDVAVRKSTRPDEKLISQHFVKMIEDFVQSRNSSSLAYNDCILPDNAGQEQLELLYIKRDACLIKSVN